MNNLKNNMIENRIDEQKDQNKTVIDLCSSSSEDDRSNTNDDDDSDDDSDDDDSNHVPLQEECHPSNDECNSPPLLKGPIHRMNDLEDQNVNRTINERMTSSSASSSANSSENHTESTSSPTAQRIGLIRSVKSASFSTTSKQTSSNPSKSCATLKPLQHEKNTNVTSTTTTSTSTSTSSTTTTSSSATTAATTTTSSSVLNKEDDSITMEQIESNMQDLCIEYCWSCDSKIYPTHGDLICEHPLLGVTSCSLCADKAYMVEDEAKLLLMEQPQRMMQPDDRNEQEMEICSWCADEDQQDDQLFLCDDCPRVFCARCVKKAHGVQSDTTMIQRLMENDEYWRCPACSPTPLIQRLRRLLLESDTDRRGDTSNDDNNVLSKPQDGDEREVQMLVDKLALLEDELEEISERLETENLNLLRKEIKEELQDDDEVEEEIKLFIQLNQDRYSNVSDAIGIIHDELEAKDVELSLFYKNRQTSGNFDDNDVDLDWKKEADKELDRRDEEENMQKGYAKGADGYKGHDSLYRDFEDLDPSERKVDELCTIEEAIEKLESIAQKKGDYSVIRNFRDKALRNDDWDLKELRVKAVHHSDLGDKIKDRKSTVTGTKMSSTNTLIVSKRRYPLNQKKTNLTKHPLKQEFNSKRSSSARVVVNREPSKKRKIVPLFLSTKKEGQEKTKEGQEKTKEGQEKTNVYGSDTKYFDDSICVFGTIGDKIISVASSLAKKLKPHQIDGCKFMWDQVFADISNCSQSCDKKLQNAVKSGCILAHNMGLGKSLQVITLVHTVLTNPVLTSNLNARLNRILLVVPVNTLANWCNEFSKWTVDVPKIRLFDFNSSGNQSGRRNVARRWQKDGGILIISFDTLSSVSKDGFFTDLLLSKPDVVILDEAHLMLKNSSSLISKALSKVVTSRKIALTGTPLQNNLMEYFRIINWVRPGCIGSEQEFEKKYMKILDESLRSDATVDVQLEGEKLVLDLTESTSSFVHRLDSSVLENDLPPIKQVVLHVRRTRVQSMLHQAFKKYRARGNNNNFLLNFAKLFPVNNHPGVLLKTFQKEIKPSESDKKEVFTARENPKIEQRVHVTKDTGQESQTSCEVIVIDDTDSEEEDVVQAAISNQPEEDGDISMENEEDKDVEWWADVAKKFEFNRIEHGGKVVLLLQLLAHAEMIGDKVIVFSQCLRTLSFIEDCLQLPYWEKTVSSINELSPGRSWGGWKPGVDYIRLDGSTSSADRDKLIKRFNSKSESEQTIGSSSNDVKLFLISVKAGGVGTNLVAANRVVLFDSSWNPAVDSQAIYRCYRYGQTKPVYAYRFLTDDSMEQKVYSRIVNKTAIAARVIDKKQPQRNFTSRELDDILQIDNWVQCDECEKWRMLPPWVEPPGNSGDDTWACKDNVFDPKRSFCSAKERDANFYNRFFEAQALEQQRLMQTSENSSMQNDNKTSMQKDNNKTVQNGENTSVHEKQGEDQRSPHVPEPTLRESGPDTAVTVEDIEKIENTKKDVILTKLLEVPAPSASRGSQVNKKKEKREFKALVTKYYYHDSLMKEATKTAK